MRNGRWSAFTACVAGLTLGSATNLVAQEKPAKAGEPLREVKVRRVEQAPARSQERKEEKHSHTRRVVVVNGETVVDEETVDGQPVRPAKNDADAPTPPRVRVQLPKLEGFGEGAGDSKDLEAELQRMLDELRAQVSPNGQGSSGAHSKARRTIVVDGEKIVDETVEGNGGEVRTGGDVQVKVTSENGERHRVVIVDGKVVSDETTADGSGKKTERSEESTKSESSEKARERAKERIRARTPKSSGSDAETPREGTLRVRKGHGAAPAEAGTPKKGEVRRRAGVDL